MKKDSIFQSSGIFKIAALTAIIMAIMLIIMNDPNGVLNGFLKSFGVQ